MRVLLKFILLIIVCSWLSSSIWAQQIPAKYITTNDGLPSSLVYKVIEDSKGYMWFCTNKGISRYNGYEFKTFTVKDGLPSNVIWDVHETKDKNGVWVATFGDRPYLIKEDSIIKPIDSPLKKLEIKQVSSFGYIGDNFFYCDGLDSAINFIRNDTIYDLAADSNDLDYALLYNSTNDSKVLEFKISFSENLVLLNTIDFKQQNISQSRPVEFQIYNDTCGLYKLIIFRLFSIKNKIYTNSRCGIFEIKDGDLIQQDIPLPDFYYDDDYRIFLQDEIIYFKGKKYNFLTDLNFNYLPQFDFIKNQQINYIFIDSEKDIWVCTADKGIYYIGSSALGAKLFDSSNLFNSNNITDLYTDEDNVLWIALRNGSIYNNESGQFETYSYAHDFQDPRLKSFSYHPEYGTIVNFISAPQAIISTTNKAPNNKTNQLNLLFKNKEFEQLKISTANKENLQNFKNFIYQDSIYYWSSRNGIFFFDRRKEDGLESLLQGERVYSIGIDQNGELWAALKKGLVTYPNSKNEGFTNHPINSYKISEITTDNFNRVWCGTDGYGVFVIDSVDVIPIKELSDAIVTEIIIDTIEHKAYIASNLGLSIISKIENLDNYEFNEIKIANGLPSNEVNCLALDNSNLYIGTSSGLAILEKKSIIQENRSTPRFVIEKVRINGVQNDVSEKYTLKYRFSIEFDYVGIAYASGQNIKYSYRLLGSSSDWITNQNRSLDLQSLSKGNYQLELKAIDTFGNESETKNIKIKVLPPWWNTWLFRLLILGLIILGFLIRFRFLREKTKQEIAVKQKVAGLELQALQSQMNPHFVFNIMNSFQRVIIEGDFMKVNEYITSFSRLMRLFLESSREKYTTIDDEIELLTTYVKLEKLRFKEKFTYQFELSGIEGNKDDFIPSMIIQPFVENAINHGLKFKEGNGQLKITFKQVENGIKVSIEDDGVGIEKAKELSAQSSHNHKSRGMEIINDRIETLKENEDFDIKIDIVDRVKQGIGQGTFINIDFFPLK